MQWAVFYYLSLSLSLSLSLRPLSLFLSLSLSLSQGYVGQEMQWAVFYYGGTLDMPSIDVSGLNGEAQVSVLFFYFIFLFFMAARWTCPL